MLPCYSKQILGVDCLGCGLQRSLILLTKGEFLEAFKMYPAIYTLIIFALFIILNFKFKFKHSKKIISRLAIINIIIMVISYLIKTSQ